MCLYTLPGLLPIGFPRIGISSKPVTISLHLSASILVFLLIIIYCIHRIDKWTARIPIALLCMYLFGAHYVDLADLILSNPVDFGGINTAIDLEAGVLTMILARDVRLVAKALMAFGVIHSAIALNSYVLYGSAFNTGSLPRSSGLFGDPNGLCFLLISVAPLLLVADTKLGTRSTVRIGKIVAILVVLLSLLVTWHRMSFLSILLGSVLILPVRSYGAYTKIMFLSAIVICIVVTFIVRQAPSVRASSSKSTDGRLLVWQSAIDQFLKSPIFGIGIGNTKIATVQGNTDDMKAQTSFEAKSTYLTIALETGLFGLTLFSTLVFFSIRNLRSLPLDARLAARIVLVSWLAFGIVNSSFFVDGMVIGNYLFGLFVGLSSVGVHQSMGKCQVGLGSC